MRLTAGNDITSPSAGYTRMVTNGRTRLVLVETICPSSPRSLTRLIPGSSIMELNQQMVQKAVMSNHSSLPRDVPFSISCYECDCDGPESLDQAIAEGWT